MAQRADARPFVPEDATDAQLAARASEGDIDAFEELYRRHVAAAWRVALAVTANPEDAADAASDAFVRVFQSLRLGRLDDGSLFRAYVVAAARNAAVDVLRRTNRLRPAETRDELDGPSDGAGPWEAMVHGVDSSLVATAFLSLPERWRSVLWLTEVEGIPPKDAADVLGVSPNGVAQLAVRARAGLRERFLQAHLRGADVRHACRHTVDRLGAYVAGGLAPREIAKVDQHLAGCPPCRDRLTELEDLGSTLRRVALPVPVGLAALGFKWRVAASAAEAAAPTGAAAAHGIGGSALLVAHKPLVMATAALFAVGVAGVGAGARLPGSGSRGPSGGPAATVAAAAPAASAAASVSRPAGTGKTPPRRAAPASPAAGPCVSTGTGAVTATVGGLAPTPPVPPQGAAGGLVPEPVPPSAAVIGVAGPTPADGVTAPGDTADAVSPAIPPELAGGRPADAVGPTTAAVGAGTTPCLPTGTVTVTKPCPLPHAVSTAGSAAGRASTEGRVGDPEGVVRGGTEANATAPEDLGRPCPEPAEAP